MDRMPDSAFHRTVRKMLATGFALSMDGVAGKSAAAGNELDADGDAEEPSKSASVSVTSARRAT